MTLVRHTTTPIVLWQVGDGYDDRIVAVSSAGLRRVMHDYLVSLRIFEHPGHHWVGPYYDSFSGHVLRAFDSKRVCDLTRYSFWALLRTRSLVASFTDEETLTAIERSAGDYIFSTELLPDGCLVAGAEEVAEWWIECKRPITERASPVFATVKAVLLNRVATRLGVLAETLDFVLLNQRGDKGADQFAGETWGTFSFRRKAAGG